MDTSCERCKGWLIREEDKWGMHLACINCGWEKAVWTVSEGDAQYMMLQDENAGRRTGYGAKNVRIMPRKGDAKDKTLTERDILSNLSVLITGNRNDR